MSIERKHTESLITWRDLPVSDGVPMDNDNHPTQAEVYLRQPLRQFFAERGMHGFVGVNSFVYYQTKPAKTKGPDFYVVNDGIWTMQGSWVVPAEGDLYPTLIVELLSKSTEEADRTTKKDFYQEVFKTQDYCIYDTENQRFEAWHLIDGAYRPVAALPSGRIPCQSLPLHLGVHGKWLRWFLPDGTMLLTDKELKEAAEQQAATAREQAATAREQAATAREQTATAREQAETAREQAEAAREQAETARAEVQRERQRRLRMARRLLDSGMPLEEVLELAELAAEDLSEEGSG